MSKSTGAFHRPAIAAQLHVNTQISRQDIFGLAEAQCRPMHLPGDSATMFAGFVGTRYTPGEGIVLLAINPGGGGDAYTERTAEDRVFFPLLERFKAARGHAVPSAFEAVNQAFAPIVRGWNLWRILGPTLEAAGLTLEEVAYMNLVPYRTRGDKMPPVAAQQAAWTRIIQPTLGVLEPRAIVTLGKKAGSVVDRFHAGGLHAYCVPRTIGDTRISDEARAVHAQMRRELCGR
ncbi:MAG: hypothetical protein K1X67_16040 [Fimbriimonadaceae bacterium]|nr:hypothetical protein [Fimbriimonadaceae bacterium]